MVKFRLVSAFILILFCLPKSVKAADEIQALVGPIGGFHSLSFAGDKSSFYTAGLRFGAGPFFKFIQAGVDFHYFFEKKATNYNPSFSYGFDKYSNYQFSPWIRVIIFKGQTKINPYVRIFGSYNLQKISLSGDPYKKKTWGYGFAGGLEIPISKKDGWAYFIEGGYQMFRIGEAISWNLNLNFYIKDIFGLSGFVYYF